MESPPPESLLIVIALVFALAGGLGVWLVRYISSGGGKKGKPSHSAAAPSAEADELSPDDGKELLRVVRTRARGLVIFVQGRHYYHLRGITDPKVGRETVEAINTVRNFAAEALPEPPPALTQRPPQTVPQPPVTPVAPRSTTASRSAPASPVVHPLLSGVVETAFTVLNMRRAVKGALPNPTDARGPLLDPLTFVEDIDELVKRRIRERPDMAGRSVHLRAGPGGGIRIYVGHQVYEAVGDITDPEVRAIIQDAIREWEGGSSGSA